MGRRKPPTSRAQRLRNRSSFCGRIPPYSWLVVLILFCLYKWNLYTATWTTSPSQATNRVMDDASGKVTTTSTTTAVLTTKDTTPKPVSDTDLGELPTRSLPKVVSYAELHGVLPMLDAIVAEYPHDTDAFTQGLDLSDDGVLFESVGWHGKSSLRRVEITTGKVLQISRLEDKYFGEGMAIIDDRIVMLTWRLRTGFVFNRHSFEVLDSFKFETSTGQGWGIVYEPSLNVLLVSDGSEYIFHWDPVTFKELRRVRVTWESKPVSRLNELAVVGGELLANIWFSTRIVRIDYRTGAAKGFLEFEGLYRQRGREDVLNGIAFDAPNNQLLITGKLWPSLYRVDYSHVLHALGWEEESGGGGQGTSS